MVRMLPPAGHPIEVTTLLGAFVDKSTREVFLSRSFRGSPSYFVCSGSAALTLVLKSLGNRSRKKKVILPAYTCPSVLASVVRAGLKPVLCDLQVNNLQMDLDQITSKMGSDTLGVIAVHLFGIPENVLKLRELTHARGTFLIEDAAQAFGNSISTNSSYLVPQFSSLNSSGHLGSFGDVGILSFGRGKPLSLLAGGAILVNNSELEGIVHESYQSLPEPKHSLRFFHYFLSVLVYSIFYHPILYWIPASIPWLKLGETVFTTEFEVERIHSQVIRLGNRLISDFDEIRKKRIEISRLYAEELQGFKDEFLFFPNLKEEDIALLRFPIIFKDRGKREQILNNLLKEGLGATGMYPCPLNEQEGIPEGLFPKASFQNAKFISERIITLPLHRHVKPEDIKRIGRIFSKQLTKHPDKGYHVT